MRTPIKTRIVPLALGLLFAGCDEPPAPLPENPGPLPDPVMPADAEPSGQVVHAMKPFELEGSQETMSCYSWTVGNDAPLYVNAVTFQNEGSFHHSNWFVVPDDVYSGEDGFWPCAEREFNDISAALSGTVLFAQSTQARRETMDFADGAVIRIPARSKIVAGVHLLNLGPDARETTGWMSLDVVHPGLVDTVLSPMLFSYRDLEIPPQSVSSFKAGCRASNGEPFEVHYLLPHYHRTGIGAQFSVYAEDDMEPTLLLDHQGFSGSPMGKSFDPPMAFDSIRGAEFSCTYDNPHDETLTWGIGINEMCVLLAFVENRDVTVSGVEPEQSYPPLEREDGVMETVGNCETLALRRGRAYDLPIRAEIEAQLQLPSSDDDAPEPPSCVDTPGISPDTPPSFEDIQARVLEPWCSFSSCHGDAAAAGLDVRGEQAHAALVDVPSTVGTLPRVAPGDPEGSGLYRLISQCEPDLDGIAARHMPAGAPTLLEPQLVGLVRAWIEAGAPE